MLQISALDNGTGWPVASASSMLWWARSGACTGWPSEPQRSRQGDAGEVVLVVDIDRAGLSVSRPGAQRRLELGARALEIAAMVQRDSEKAVSQRDGARIVHALRETAKLLLA